MVPIIIPTTRKGLLNVLKIGIAISVLCFLATMVFWVRDQQQLKEHGQPNFNTLPIEQLEDGLIVTGTIDLSLGTFAETYETNSGIRQKSTALYYVIPIYGLNGDGNYVIQYFIGFKAEPEDFALMDKIYEQTWIETDDPAELTVEHAYIHDMDSDYWQFFMEFAENPSFYDGGSFIDWCTDYYILGTDDREIIESRIVPYYIDETETAGVDLLIAWLFLGIGIILLLLFLTLRKKDIKEEASRNKPQNSLY